MQILIHLWDTEKTLKQGASVNKKNIKFVAYEETHHLNYCARKTMIIAQSKLKRYDNIITESRLHTEFVSSLQEEREKERERERKEKEV